jgi:hypothetical protein
VARLHLLAAGEGYVEVGGASALDDVRDYQR